ncbi:GNVR domain-containing protein [Thalassotalea atypica]|uniref:GNVR domain-containing protein n=1 Tax=Thalassotalea atypica TaxID=2054316 RepID=UPI0025743876|nr:GNVR domain-containing protein [Thalassotalea atypica]
MESTQLTANQTTEELSLYGLFSLFLQNWLTLVISGFSFAIIALIWAVNQANVYKAQTLLMPVSEEQSSLGGLAGDLGGLAAVAGLSLGEGGDENAKLALELIKSQAFLGEFIKENDLVVPIMAASEWDPVSDTLIIDPEVYDVESKTWVRTAPPSRKQIPSIQETFEVFSQLLEVEQDPKSGFVVVSLEFYSPNLAAKWTILLIEKLNEAIRVMDRNEADNSIKYLQKLAEESYVQELRKAFTSLMEEQIKSRMLTEIRKDYVFKVVDPAVVPELKHKPRRSIIVVVAGFLGGIIGLIIILFRTGRAEHIKQQSL